MGQSPGDAQEPDCAVTRLELVGRSREEEAADGAALIQGGVRQFGATAVGLQIDRRRGVEYIGDGRVQLQVVAHGIAGVPIHIGEVFFGDTARTQYRVIAIALPESQTRHTGFGDRRRADPYPKTDAECCYYATNVGSLRMEARSGIEPLYAALQAAA
jgi:hypothetical protein